MNDTGSAIVSAIGFLFQVIIGLGVVWYMVFILFGLPRKIAYAYTKFAVAHGLRFMGIVSSPLGYKGMLPGRASYTIVGIDVKRKRHVQVFRWIYTTGNGRSKHDYNRTVIDVSIKPTGVRVFVNSRLNDATEQVRLARPQRYTAEGDFGKYFDLYIPKGVEVSALSIFAPDVMAHIMAEYGFYDMEIADDHLYLYDYRLISRTTDLEKLYQLAIRLAQEIDDNAPRKPNLAPAKAAPAESAVTSLKREAFPVVWLTAIPLIVLLQCVGSLGAVRSAGASPSMAIVNVLLAIAPLVLVAAGIIYRLQYYRHQKRQYLADRQLFAKQVGLTPHQR